MSRAYDVVIVGASFGGVAAALAAAADPKVRVALLEPSDWVGGQATAQGVTRWDEAGVELIETVGSTKSYRDLRNALRARVRHSATLSASGAAAAARGRFNPGFDAANYPFAVDPQTVRDVLLGLIAAAAPRLDLHLNTRVVRVDVADGNVTAVTTTTGEAYTARIYLDATDLGDLLPLAGIPWTIGAESRAQTGEADAPETAHPEWVQPVTVPIAVERRPAGEHHVVARPQNYDEIARVQNFRVGEGDIDGVFSVGHGSETLFGYRQYVDARNFTDAAHAHDRTTLNVGSNDYQTATLPTGDAARDAAIYDAARETSIAYLYWLQTAAPRDDGTGPGYPNIAVRTDAFGTADGCAPQAYIRESRRIDPVVRVVQADVDARGFPPGTPRARRFRDACGIGWYGIDVHPSAYGTPWIGFSTLRFQIPLGALLPKQLGNLVASCKNIGTTHVTSGAYRVHPVEWAVGEAAGVLAAFCCTQNVAAKDVQAHDDRLASYRYRLLARGVPVFWWSDVAFEDGARAYAAIQHCGATGAFGGVDGLRFAPADRLGPDGQRAVDGNLGRTLPWPAHAMTRSDAAVFVCEQMGWPIG